MVGRTVGPTTRIAVLLGVAVVGTSPSAHAYDVQTPISDPCHERATMTAAVEADILDLEAEVPLPDRDDWQDLRPLWEEHLDVEVPSTRVAFVLHSLYVGVRDPDTGGRSVANPRNIRRFHLTEGTIELHCTRWASDDGPVEAQVMARCREVIVDALARMDEALQRPPPEQIADVPFTLDFYGQIELPVWLPAFELGRALHTLQDSFAHSIRTPDMRVVWHVLNFVDALEPGYDQRRDGIRHSDTLDECNEVTEEPFVAAIEASAELIEATLTAPRQGAAQAVLVDWMSSEPGCDIDNDYCGSPWVAIARTDTTQPILTSCAIERRASVPGPWAGLALLALGAACRRRPKP